MDNGAVISTINIGNGNGGPISITCEQGQLSNQSEVSSGSFANAGAVHITANSFTLSSNSSVNASAAVNGGDITIRSTSLLALFDSNIQSYAGIDNYVNAAGGVGGNILIDPAFVILDNSFISANDLAPLGRDGNISNLADFFFTNDSFLHAHRHDSNHATRSRPGREPRRVAGQSRRYEKPPARTLRHRDQSRIQQLDRGRARRHGNLPGRIATRLRPAHPVNALNPESLFFKPGRIHSHPHLV